jgi:hypothetical protein
LHEAIEGADVPEDAHTEVFNRALEVLRAWVYQTQQRHHLAHCSYKAYDDLCEQIPMAVEAALRTPVPHAPAERVVRRRITPLRRPAPRRPRYH